MKKETLLEIILGTIGGIIFAIGMCMCLIPEWHIFEIGMILSVIGMMILLTIIPVYQHSHPKVVHKPVNWGIVFTWVAGVIGTFVMGFGMSKIMVGTASNTDMIIGMVTGIIGLIVCILNYPIYSYCTRNN